MAYHPAHTTVPEVTRGADGCYQSSIRRRYFLGHQHIRVRAANFGMASKAADII